MRFALTIYLFFALTTSPCLAAAQENTQDQNTPTTEEPNPETVPIPLALRQHLRPNVTKEDFMSQVMQFLRREGFERKKLTASDIERKKTQALQNARRAQIQNLMFYDTNFDAQVTLTEARNYLIEVHSKRVNGEPSATDNERILSDVENQLKLLKELDTNKDEILTYQEMSELGEETKTHINENYTSRDQSYLNLDPDKNGELTDLELEALALKAFNNVDKDRDGIIAEEEFKSLDEFHKTNATDAQESKLCEVKTKPGDLKIVSIGAYEGQALSTVTAVGQDKETLAATIKIKDDQPETYLILTSYEAIIWKIEGNTQAIKQVVVASFETNKKKKSGSGVVGIEKDRVTFLGQKCIPYYHDMEGVEILSAKSAIKYLTGRFPDEMGGSYGANEIVLSEGKVSFPLQDSEKKNKGNSVYFEGGEGNDVIIFTGPPRTVQIIPKEKDGDRKDRDGKPLPPGFNDELWRELLRFHPAGIAEFDPSSVVSDLPAERYEVMPKWAGIAQLVNEGAIEILHSGDFRIIKDIPRLPTGFYGISSVKFVIAPGLKVLNGIGNHSCVIREDAVPPRPNGALCR